VLHKDRIGHEMFDDHLYRSGLPDRMEYQANALAADILMPRKLIRVAQLNGLSRPADLAREFGVSERAMEIRLSST
jgi:Zn-dependent peptidase ImmA (M78 family)